VTFHWGVSRRVVAAGALATTVALASCSSGGSEVITQSVDSPSTAMSVVPSTASSEAATDSQTVTTASSAGSSEPPTTEISLSVTPWPADFTPSQQEIAKSALAAITGFTEVVAKANAYPGQDWTALIRTYAADPAAMLSLQSIRSLAEAGVHATAPSTYENPTVLSAEDIRAVVDICVDRSDATLVDADGTTVLGPPDVPRSVVTYTVVKYAPADGGWLVTETAASNPVRQC
jgi:hypothetical protein